MSVDVAAVDLGAESGRVARVAFDGERLTLGETHRFEHLPEPADGKLRWDLEGLWGNIADGLAAVAANGSPAAVGVDAWGVDYGLLDGAGELVERPTSYRGTERVDAYDRAIERWGGAGFYAASGIQVMPINTVFGLLADLDLTPELVGRAERMLMLPDLFHHRLSGATVTEYSAASTSGLLDMRDGRWSAELLDRVGIPERLMPEVAQPGTDLGPVIGALADRGLAGTRVILPAAHDTASAVLGLADRPASTMYISSGTWSLAGVTLPAPIISETSQALNLTNEGGPYGTIRLLRNLMGLWILQECRRQWRREGLELSYDDLVAAASAEPALVSVVDVNDTEFLAPGDMPERIRRHCAEHGQPVPQTPGAVARVAIDSLALGYRRTAQLLAELTGVPITDVAVIGGGSRNALLQQATADALGVPVTCGPIEATALGNAAVQLSALGELGGIDEIAAAIRASEPTTTFEPRDRHPWSAAADRLERQAEQPVGTAYTRRTQ